MTKFDELKKVIEAAEEHNTKFDNGNQAAGTRLRKSMMEVISLAKGLGKRCLILRTQINHLKPPLPLLAFDRLRLTGRRGSFKK